MTILVSNNGDDIRFTLAEDTSCYRSFADLRKAWESEWGKECGSFDKWMWYMRKHNLVQISNI